MKVSNMKGKNGREIPNQFIIESEEGIYFQSYKSLIALKKEGKIYLDKDFWNYSKTTGKYRNLFLGEAKKEFIKEKSKREFIPLQN